MAASQIIVLVLVIIGVNVALYKFIFGRIKRVAEEAKRKADEDLFGKGVKYGEDFANFFGQKSLGVTQVRGNGIFRITEDEIYFRMLMPSKVYRYQVSKISAVETPNSFLGKTKFVPLLKVEFIDEQGNKDSAAWLLKGLDVAKNVLELVKE